VLTYGDNAYDNGTVSQFNNCYDPSWGRAKTRTRPTLGGHDYGTANAAGYFGYFQNQLAPFGASASDPLRGYYSYDLGAWHVVHTNTECVGVGGCNVTAQIGWLQADLQAHQTSCTLVITHNPRWSSGSVHGDNSSIQAYWQAMYDNDVDLVLTGDDHDYERFAPQNPSGAGDSQRGIRQLVVGTGGYSHYLFSDGGIIKANSEVRNDDTFGLIKVTLHATSYEWEFLPQAGKSFTDSGNDTCH
jgi:acid phosphatase type 7